MDLSLPPEHLEREEFTHEPLKDLRDIRLIRPFRDEDDPPGQLRCEIAHMSLEDLPFFYIAMSYYSGDPTPTKSLWYREGKYLNMSNSVAAMLQGMVTNYSHEQHLWLWVDALCIDQGDPLEKGQQVEIISTIYRKAERVVAWLGDHTRDSRLAFELLDTYRAEIEMLKSVGEPLTFERLSRDPKWNPLTPYWDAVANFLHLPYFNRIWIVPEIISASRVEVRCGDWSMDWNSLHEVVELFHLEGYRHFLFFLEDHHMPFCAHGVWNIRLISFTKTEMRINGPKTLEWLLLNFWRFEASDPRDMIFALLGIALETSILGILPDYSEFSQNLYISTARSLLLAGAPGILHAAGTGSDRQMIGLPSWVPDWTGRHDPLIGGATIGWLAGGVESVKFRDNSDPTSIRTEAYLVDKVARVFGCCPSIPYHRDLNRTKEYVASQIAWIDDMTSIMASSPRLWGYWLEAFWRTLVSGRTNTGVQLTIEFHDCYLAYLNYQRAFLARRSLDEPVNFPNEEIIRVTQFNDVLIEVIDHPVFMTDGDHLGLGPPGTAVGDDVAIIPGLAKPFLLRNYIPTDPKPGVLDKSVVGSCYIDDMMHGQGTYVEDVELQGIDLY